MTHYRSFIQGNQWPTLLPHRAARLLALQYQFERSEMLASERREARQFEQLALLWAHAVATVPHYRAAFGEQGGAQPSGEQLQRIWRDIPILTREQLQRAGAQINSTALPAGHGATHRIQSSGSTGMPVSVLATELVSLLWFAFTLRDHLWHRRDLSGRLATIRSDRGRTGAQGVRGANWGIATEMFATGPSFVLDPGHDLNVQLDWLSSVQPDYLLSFPSNLLALGERLRERRVSLTALRELRTFGETLAPGMRSRLETLWAVKVVDVYSAQEVGYLALQCPQSPVYHAQAENILLEVLDESGSPCQPGEVGRVVVTALHNFASPLIRYEIGDWAEVGSACGCRRSLPVIERILGRTRNMVRLPDGSSHWPSFRAAAWSSVGALRQLQMVQTSLYDIVVHLVAETPLAPEQEQRLTAILRASLGYPFRFELHYLETIPRSASGKYEDFICQV